MISSQKVFRREQPRDGLMELATVSLQDSSSSADDSDICAEEEFPEMTSPKNYTQIEE
jgi:hypothetical protein